MSFAIASLMEHPPSDIPSDEYVRRIRNGDIAAFDAIFRMYYPRLFAFAESYGHTTPDIAEDIVCDIFGWIWRFRTEWRPSTSIEAYLYGAVRNKVQNLTRNARRDLHRRTLYLHWGESPGSAQGPQAADTVIERNEVRDIVRQAIGTLSETHQLIVLLRWEKQWSWDEIAEVVGISNAAAQMQHLRALKALRRILPEYFSEGA